MAERFKVGQRVTWLKSQQRDGRLFDEPIAGIVREVTTMRVRVEVAVDSRRVLRDVRPERLQPREQACAELGEV